ncbi:MAG: hypothetical protein JXR31_01290 [Prolixibacteraceae bacterium]|nr:hypothetical protein [Prolixibacteraceae bacterium]
MITEFISFELSDGIGHEQLILQADRVVNEFHKKQDGYVDMELVCENSGKQWQMVIHYQTMDDIEKVKTNLPKSCAIKGFTELIRPGTMKVSFYGQKGKWEV